MATLKTLRQRRLLNQEELANKIGVSPTTLSYWETGKRRPRFPHIRKLAEALDVSYGEIISAIEETMEKEAA